jgi:hypothetical protein
MRRATSSLATEAYAGQSLPQIAIYLLVTSRQLHKFAHRDARDKQTDTAPDATKHQQRTTTDTIEEKESWNHADELHDLGVS